MPSRCPLLCRVFALLVLALSLPALHAASAGEEPALLLVTHARFFTMAPGQQQSFLGYMLVSRDGTIAALAAGDPPAAVHAASTFDAHGHWIMPGFISAHSHLWQAAYRGLAANKTLPGWIADLYGARATKAAPEDYYWFALDGALDHLQHGITAAYDFAYGGTSWDNPAMKPGAIDFDTEQYRAELASGIRFVHGYQVEKVPPGTPAETTLAVARPRLRAFLDYTAAHPSPRALSTMLNGSTAFNETPQQAVMEAALMREFHLGNQSHYLEPPDTIAAEQAKFPWFVDGGLMQSTLIFGHFIHTTDAILEQTAKAGAGMSWNPLSNGRLASGTADIPKYLKYGIRVGMGVDGEASADLADPFENLRTGLYAIRDKYQSATAMSPYQVLSLHTMGSADVLGVKSRLGSLEPGKYADFLVIDPTDFGPVFDPYASLVLIGSQRELERVYVGGQLMVDHGHLLHADADEVERQVDHRVQSEVKTEVPAIEPAGVK
ncbi:amidohydrolase family protein [Silvibacterium dinghuense]|uniref:S-adenosylhomocysteine deaminase n=1 Tax=Silvibacterium dinghuense TaxID=1560006 RepID=A0A4V1NUX9_9BACT|nr:amidohydrolase family protein [Silvibacterium dinghuense]RXS93814.1 S-adenosylhomocysteine deaminase [Silvibacterium dinghuense]